MSVFESNKSNKIYRGFTFSLIVAFAIFIGIIINIGIEYDQPVKTVQKLSFIGNYEIGEKIGVISDEAIETDEKCKQVILKGHFNRDIYKGEEVFFFVNQLNMELIKNGKKIYTYDTTHYPTSLRSGGTEWLKVSVEDINELDDIEIILESAYYECSIDSYNLFLKNMYMGDRYAFIRQQLSKNICEILGLLLIIIIDIIFFTTVHPVKALNIPVIKGYMECSIFVLFGTIFTFINCEYISLIINNTFILSIIDLMARLLGCKFLIAYLKVFLVNKHHIKYATILGYMANGIIWGYFFLQLLGKINVIQMTRISNPIGIIMEMTMLIWVIKDYKKIEDRSLKIVAIPSMIVTILMIIEMFHYILTTIYWGYVFQIGLLLLISTQLIVCFDNKRKCLMKVNQAKALENEIINNRIAIMMSQIQPHFLYNTLTSIQELCLCDPEKAHEALMKFSHFLRGNMNSLTTTELIPFANELQHVQNYIYLEQVRYGDYLKVVYEINEVDFLLPALSIQPIVENAVRYGIGKKEEGGTVWLKTKQTDHCYQIIIEDDGIGMELADNNEVLIKENSREHVGIKNVKYRLLVQCNGKLTIESKIGSGTKVIICIPKREETKE